MYHRRKVVWVDSLAAFIETFRVGITCRGSVKGYDTVQVGDVEERVSATFEIKIWRTAYQGEEEKNWVTAGELHLSDARKDDSRENSFNIFSLTL